jgi:L-rhamnose isomerase
LGLRRPGRALILQPYKHAELGLRAGCTLLVTSHPQKGDYYTVAHPQACIASLYIHLYIRSEHKRIFIYYKGKCTGVHSTGLIPSRFY